MENRRQVRVLPADGVAGALAAWLLRLPMLLGCTVAVAVAVAEETNRGAAPDGPRVLILQSYDRAAEPYATLTDVFTVELQNRIPGQIVFTEMNLDARWGDMANREALIAELLKNRSTVQPADLVVAVGPPATEFWLRHRDTIDDTVPFIAAARENVFSRTQFRQRDAGVWTEFSFRQQVEDILRVRPNTSHIVLVLGSSESEKALAAQAATEMADLSERLTIEYTTDLSLAQIQEKLGALPGTAAVWYGIFNVDSDGMIFRHDSGLSLIREASPMPVFGSFDDQLGSGIVGGRLIELEAMGIAMADAGQRQLEGLPVENPWLEVALSQPVYDWRELDSGLLPPGSTIRYQPRSVVAAYFGWIVLIVGVLSGQSLLIAALLRQRRARRSAEHAQAQLSGRLIHAHEEERRRLARELHDDLSQQLARLAIDAAVIGKQSNGAEALKEPIGQLRNDLSGISEYVHDLSYRLHPSVLEDLGLVTALQTECDQVRQRYDLNVIESLQPTDPILTGQAALCIYRVAQEALNNAVRHAGADTAEVVFFVEKGEAKLVVKDNGAGFDPASDVAPAGLGLSSMRERVRLLNGTLEIISAPGKGTRITATVPVEPPL